ncbi:MAG: hypothetical protein IBJ10_06935 [Phycisphaerales bacterium]|nr:hypothetical protein [Phycisphaerales bacterium]
MASKGSSNAWPLVWIVLLLVLTVGFFVTSIVFLARAQRLQTELAQRDADQQNILRSSERTDQIQSLLAQAQAERKSLVVYLSDSLRETMRRVTGSERDTLAALRERLDALDGADASSLLSLVRDRDQAIANLRRQLADAQDASARAQSDLQAEVSRVSRLISDQQATIAALNQEVGQYKAEVETYRASVGSTIDTNNERVADMRRNFADDTARLEDQNRRLREENLILAGQLDTLRAERSADLLRPNEEYALVDGRIVSVNPVARTAYIDLSRDKRLVLGMTFEVYADPSSIRPGADGAYPRGKATVEVIEIGDTASTVRIIRENRGNPIIAGDVFANALYDPNKTYSFVVAGDFDLDGDGVASAAEAREVRAIIGNWGGAVRDDLAGDTDFLVLGDRPRIPPQPPATAPVAVIDEFIRLQRAAGEYDRLFETARQTGIPVLNQNRLYTLTGLKESR